MEILCETYGKSRGNPMGMGWERNLFPTATLEFGNGETSSGVHG